MGVTVSALGFIVISPAGPRRAFETPGLAIAAARAGAIGVLDAEFVQDEKSLRKSIERLCSQSLGGTVGIRCQHGKVASDELLGLFPTSQGRKSFLILTAGIGAFDRATLETDIKTARAKGFTVVVETVDIDEAKLAESAGADAIVAKGHESSGRVGDTTTFVLVQQCARAVRIPVYAQGGIGLHSAAAVAAAGAQGVVLDSQLYLCRDSLIPADVQLRFERLDGSETSLVRDPQSQGIRLLATNGSNRLQQLEQLYADGRVADAESVLAENILADDDELFLAGQDSCFAKNIALAGGTVAGCLDAINRAVDEHLEVASRSKVLGEGSDLAVSHGSKYPVVQGAMTRVSDTSAFAHSVAEAGALPFLALSLMRGPEIEKLLNETRTKLGGMPWGVGILGFVPQQLRQEQMEVVNRHKPPFALIAGGRPDQAKALDDAGTLTYLHVPSPLLLKSFIEMGSTRFIFEGKECGGHVGPRSSFVLWETMIEVLLQSLGPKSKAANYHVLFAGGIHDDLSAAMVATMAAPLTARGIKVGVLLGTAYLFTEEAVSAGAIVPVFQDAALKCDKTVLLETGPGHSIRCIESPYKKAFDQCRVDLQKQNKSRDEIREELELMNLGRLRIASKGITRGASNELEEIPVETQWRDGMYMIGQVAAMRDKVVTMADLHHNICSDGQKRLAELSAKTVQVSVEPSQTEGIAIVGMSCMFPQGNDVETYWQNILNKVDTITEVPETHFKWQNYYDPNPLARDRVISKWGGFISDVVFDPTPYGIPPSSLESIDPMQVLVLETARSALHDAGYNERRFPREKTSVILANAGHGPITALYSLRSMLGWKLEDLDDATQEEIKQALPEWTEDSFAGYLGNVTAGRVANRLDLKGLNFSIDAACASSLAALYVAISDLRAGTSDVVLLGATDTHNQPGDYLSFSKTHALSPKGRCQTFDENADGIVISEGLAMVVLKRLSDAERDGDRIYAVIKGIGGSSDGRDLSLTAPRPAGQMLALERAYHDAGISPSTIGLVEAHGTGTVAGDKAEVEALTKVFQQAGAAKESCAIGSVKTNIGHSKAAAGLASILKVAKALHHKVLPPSINVKKPSPACKFGEGPFYLNTECRPWIHDAETPRRAGVSAFGFGGTNFHTVLEEYVAPCSAEEVPTVHAWPAELFVWKAASQEDLVKTLKQTELSVEKLLSSETAETEVTSLDSRRLFELASKLQLRLNDNPGATNAIAIVASSLTDLKSKLALAKDKLQAPDAAPFSMPNGMHYACASDGEKKVAFLFPGQGSQRVDMLKGLSLYFPEIRKTIEESDAILQDKIGCSISRFIYPSPTLLEAEQAAQHERLTQTQIAQPALGVCDLAMLRVLKSFGLKPDMVAGHSYGEYVALYAAGVISDEQLLKLSADRGRILGDAAAQNPGAMAAVSADQSRVLAVIKDIPDVYLANSNTPTQNIISGSVEAIEASIKEFKKLEIPAKRISVSAAFHSPLLTSSKEPLARALKENEFNSPSIPVYSNTTAAPYPSESKSIVSQLSEHALKPVLFTQQLQAMHDAGARIFVEVGPGAVLTGLAEATLSGKGAQAVSLERAKNSLEHFLSVIGLLTVNGAIKNIGKLFWNRMSGVHGQSYEFTVAQNRSALLYRVNSVKIEKVDKVGNRQLMSKQVNQTVKNADNNGGIATKEVVKNQLVRDEYALPAVPSNGTNGSNGHNGNGSKPAPSNGNGRAVPVSQVAAQRTTAPQPAAYQSAAQPAAVQPALPQPLQNQLAYQQHIQQPVHQQQAFQQPVAYQQPMQAAPRKADGSTERVMMEFQRSMLEMTDRFLETQERVMLAYLRAGGTAQPGMFPQPAQQFSQEPQQFVPQQYATPQQYPAPQQYQVPQQQYQAPQQQFYPQTLEVQQPAPHYEPALVQNETAAVVESAPVVESVLDEPAQEAGSSQLNTEMLIDSLYEIVSERTGYPRQMLDPTLDLEADLGIDSIKRVEILNNFRKLLPEFSQEKLESGIEKLAGTKTLEGIIEWINGLNDDAPGETLAPEVLEAGNAANVARGIVTVKSLEAAKATALPLGPLTLIVADRSEYASAVERTFVDRGQKTVVVHPADLQKNGIEKSIAQVRKQHGSIGSLVYLSDSSKSEGAAKHHVVTNLFELAKELETDLREYAAKKIRSAVVSATFLGGDFCSGSVKQELPLERVVEQAGLVGLSKTVAKEFAGVHVKAVDFAGDVLPAALAQTIWTELTADDDIVEIGLQGDKRVGLDVAQSPYAPSSTKQAPLTASSVVLVTGGARGITAEIALDLAHRYQPTFLLVGRLPRPTDAESPVTAGLETQKDIKAAIIADMQANGKIINVRDVEKSYQQLLREREVRTTLSRLQAAGSSVRYFSVDVTDEAAFSRLIDSIYETSTIDGIIHGAGIIEDALIKDKTVESFERVFTTKVESALTLARKVRFDSLKFIYFFSSVVGRTGNAGQADYVSANEALSKLALHINRKQPTHVASLMWGPWQAGMAPPELEEVFASHGWSMIQPADGRTCFYEELNHEQADEVEVLLVGKLKGRVGAESASSAQSERKNANVVALPTVEASEIVPSGVILNVARVKSADPTTFSVMINVNQHRYLDDHKFDGIPVMPMAVALEIMTEAAKSVYPDRHIVQVSNLDIPAGIVFHSDQKEFLVEVKPERGQDGLVTVTLLSAGSINKPHFKCKIELASAPNAVPAQWTTPGDSEIPGVIGTCSTMPCIKELPQPDDVYGKWLFHGPMFQGIKQIDFLAEDGIEGCVTGSNPKDCVTNADSSRWNIDPVLLDSAMQLAGIWARHYRDVTVLPTGFKALHFFGPIPMRATAQIFLNPAMATELLCDLAVYDENGNLSFVVEGLGGIASKAFNRFSQQEPVKQLVQ